MPALLLLGAGVAIVAILLRLEKPPGPASEEMSPLPSARTFTVRNIPLRVHGRGTVMPRVELDIVPEVAGRVVFLHSGLTTGGVIAAHERILQIDPTEYELAVRQARAAVAEAEARLEVELAQAQMSRRDWQRLNPQREPDSPLVFREPQAAQARAALELARVQLATAELRLQRTSISLPFDVLVAGARVGLGHFAPAGEPVAKAYGIEAFEVEVPFDRERLAWFDASGGDPSRVSDDSTADSSPAAQVKAVIGDKEHVWPGVVLRPSGRVDQTSQEVAVVVEVSQPFDTAENRPQLLPGTTVEVTVVGRTLENAIAVPKEAVHGVNVVWLVNDGRAHTRRLKIVSEDEDFVYVVAGIADGTEVILSRPGVILAEGMPVRTGLSTEH